MPAGEHARPPRTWKGSETTSLASVGGGLLTRLEEEHREQIDELRIAGGTACDLQEANLGDRHRPPSDGAVPPSIMIDPSFVRLAPTAMGKWRRRAAPRAQDKRTKKRSEGDWKLQERPYLHQTPALHRCGCSIHTAHRFTPQPRLHLALNLWARLRARVRARRRAAGRTGRPTGSSG